jgi:asparagine synthase (glutamine-hydrolysing)
MCGICGVINFNKKQVEVNTLTYMMKAIKHRGPDDEGYYIDNNVGLGHVRLSIIDLSAAGHQPMFSIDKRFSIVFNGEIYNYIELKRELEGKYQFKTKTDTEVLLYSYIEWGEKSLHKLNGMFAFAIYDSIEKTTFIARDRFGIKPCFYFLDNENIIFASDIPAILATKNFKAKPNDQSVYDFLFFNRTNYNTNTFFQNIKKLEHGSYIKIKNDNVTFVKWYDLKDELKQPFQTKEEFLDYFRSSLQLQLRSDVPLGVCLSGGLDSSSIASAIVKYFEITNLNTFSAVYKKGDRGDESDFIDQFKSTINFMHFTNPSAESFVEDIDDFVECLVEPVPGTSEYAEYKVMQLSKKYVTVLLNGQGADEYMAGYLYFAGYYYKELFKKMKFITLFREMFYDKSNHKSLEGHMAFIYFLLPDYLKNKFSNTNKSYINHEFSSKYSGSVEIIHKLYNSSNLKESFLTHFEHKFEHNLVWADRSGMWFSLETRFPFLDHRIVEKMIGMENDKIIKNGWNKKFFRDSMDGILPEKIRLRKDKVGYETPENEWFRTKKFKSLILDLLNDTSGIFNDYIDTKKANELYLKHLDRKINISTDIWKWIHLKLWLQKFIGN